MNKVIIFFVVTMCLSVSFYGQTGIMDFGGASGNIGKVTPFSEKIKEYKHTSYYQIYNFHRGMAVGFGVPGIILLTTPVLFGTVPVVLACSKYGYDWKAILSNDALVIGISYYCISIGIGALFTGISAVNIVLAAWQLNKWRKAEKSSMALSVGYERGPLVAVTYTF